MEKELKYEGKKLDLSCLERQENLLEEPPLQWHTHRCLYCYEALHDASADFHAACNKKFFGVNETPLFDFNNQELKKLASQITATKTTVPGVQAKLSLDFTNKKNDTLKRLTIVGMHGNYILKPASVYYKQLPEVEHLTMMMANSLGMATVPHTLFKLSDGSLAYLCKRVDRKKDKKLHMEDLCQLSNRLTEDKYKGSHEQVARVISQTSSNPRLDVLSFYELVLFCFITGNADMHLKNFSMLMDESMQYQLCPAYDLLATTLVNPADKEELALTINGKKSKLKYNDFGRAFETNGLNRKVLDNLIAKFFQKRPKLLALIETSFLTEKLKSQYKSLLDERYRRLLLN
jgi:serine/threonine-protein kinase HipA